LRAELAMGLCAHGRQKLAGVDRRVVGGGGHCGLEAETDQRSSQPLSLAAVSTQIAGSG
jgi:hypothetical protein